MKQQEITKEIIHIGERQVQKDGWKILATSRNQEGRDIIRGILKEFELSEILYHPNLLIEKTGDKFFIIFSEKEKFPVSKTKKNGEIVVTGIDWFKYQLAEYIEIVTGIQVGLMMYSKETGELVMKQMNQLEKPKPWFKGDGCLLQAVVSFINNPTDKKDKRLQKVFENPLMTLEEKQIIDEIKTGGIVPPILKCIQCYNNLHPICHRCIKGRHKRIKAMAIWETNEFQREKLSVQPQLFLPNTK